MPAGANESHREDHVDVLIVGYGRGMTEKCYGMIELSARQLT